MRTLLLFLFFLPLISSAQEPISFKQLNSERIATNRSGMEILGVWGGVNLAQGIAGYAIAKDQEWRSFHQMNAIWGVVNVGIAVAGSFGVKAETERYYSYGDALHRYESTKRLYLINAGLDCIYICSGLYLTEHAKNETHNPDVWRGYGKSIILQGVGLLIFDALMFSAHNSKDKRWYKLVKGISVSGNGIGLTYKI